MPEVRVAVEGFDLKVRGGEKVAREVVDATLPGSWRLVAGIADPDQFDVFPDGPAPDVGTAWEMARRIALDERVVSCEPLLVTPGIVGDETAPEVMPGAELEAPRVVPEPNWHIDHCSIRDAWNLSKGEGIVVGHPDTGYMKHSQIWSNDAAQNRVLHSMGFDFVNDDADPLVAAGGSTHGTATASVIMSGGTGVLGVAPKAKLIPLRVDKDVIHWRWGRVRRAIEWATEKNVDVISMSLGGPIDGDSLHQAVQKAVAKGIIVIAAAGNVWPFVVYPAKYEEVLAVAATNIDRKKWGDSARGAAVDVCAPGEDVHRATFDENGQELVQESSGTSYATAVLAGIAALWLAHHKRAALEARYGRGNVSKVFRHVVMKHGIGNSPNWDTRNLGAGIVDARRVLEAPLPDLVTIAAPEALEPESTRFDEIAAYFPSTPPEEVRERVVRMLDTTDAQLESVLEVYGNELKLHLAIDPDVRARIEGTPESPMVPEAVAPEASVSLSPGLAARMGM